MRIIRAIAVLIAAAATASAQDRTTAAPALNIEFSRPITVRFADIRLSQALRDLGRVAGVKVTLAPNVEDARLRELMFVSAAFEDVFAAIVGGECLAYKITGLRSILVTRSPSGGKSNAHGPRAITWPDCADGYVPPAPPKVKLEGFRRIDG
jgi:hypothetical protein